MLKAATYAPSAKHQQNWHFDVITNKEKIYEIAKVVGDRHMEIANLADNEKDQTNMSKFLKYYTVFKNAPVLILVYAKPYKTVEYKILKDKPECKELYDMVASSQAEIQTIGAAVENLLLAAANMGYGACYMTGPIHSRDKIYEVMGHDETKGELMAFIISINSIIHLSLFFIYFSIFTLKYPARDRIFHFLIKSNLFNIYSITLKYIIFITNN